MKKRYPRITLLAIIMALALALLTNMNALANSVTINDQARVLDQAKVHSEAAKLPTPVFIYTTRIFTEDLDIFQEEARDILPDQNSLALALNLDTSTSQPFVDVELGSNVDRLGYYAHEAVQAFKNNFKGEDYTSAIIAAIDSLRDSLNGGSKGRIIVALLLGGGALIAIILIIISARRRRRGGPPQRGRGLYPYPGYYGGGSSYGGGAGSGSGAGGSF